MQWGQRSRATTSPSSALSGALTLVGARPDGSDAVITINRDVARRDAYSQSYTFPNLVYVGKYTLRARFYAESDTAGALVAQATVPTTIASNGTGISDIILSGTIAKVTFPPQEILYSGLNDLQYLATDAQDNVIAVSPGSVFYRIQSGSNFVRFNSDQYAEGIAPGVASIIATIDGRDSLPGTLRVDAPAVVTVLPNNPLIAVNSELHFSAIVANVTDQSVRWQMRDENTGTIDANGVYKAPNREGDFTIVATSIFDPRARVEMVVHVRTGTLPVIIE